jgi:tRNA(fMet)-specific endonuclease VapC
MRVLLVDTDAASILFRTSDSRKLECAEIVAGAELAISFMTQAELLLWPRANKWGAARTASLHQYLRGYVTLMPDDETCEIWAEACAGCRAVGRPISAADAWVAATAKQWDLPLVTGNHRDFEAVAGLVLVAIG